MLQLADCFGLDLPDLLTSDFEDSANLMLDFIMRNVISQRFVFLKSVTFCAEIKNLSKPDSSVHSIRQARGYLEHIIYTLSLSFMTDARTLVWLLLGP